MPEVSKAAHQAAMTAFAQNVGAGLDHHVVVEDGVGFHVCGDGGITAAFLFFQVYGSYRYGHTKKSTLSSFSFSPDIRPPISSL